MKKLFELFCSHDMTWYTTDAQGRRIYADYYDVKRTYKRLPNSAYKQCSKCGKLLSYEESYNEAKKKITNK